MRKWIVPFFIISTMLISGCSPTFLQSRRVAKPFKPDTEMSCGKLRSNIDQLRKALRNNHDSFINCKQKPSDSCQEPKLFCKTELANLFIQENGHNTKQVGSPKEKLDLMLSSQLLLTANEAMQFVKTINDYDILAITCREVEETFSPGIGEGIAYADFRRTGEDYVTHLVCDNDHLIMVFPTDNGPIDEYDRDTIFNLIGGASGSAVSEGVKKAIP